MDILYITQYYPPEGAAPAVRVSELAHQWAGEGHRVRVLTGFPNHPGGRIYPGYRARWRRLVMRENDAGVRVLRVFLIPLPNRRPWERVVNYISFMLTAAFASIFIRRPDVIIATSPQLLVGISGWWARLVKRSPLVFEVRDLWPDAIVSSGVGREETLFSRSLELISRFLYHSCDLNVVVTGPFRNELENRYAVPPGKIEVIENGVDVSFFSGRGSIDDRWVFDQKFVVVYVGTVGIAHGLGTLLDVARAVEDDFVFVVAGDGAEREALQRRVQQDGLTNVVFTGTLPRSEVPALLDRADAALVMLKKAEVFQKVIPTKLLEAMASGTPVVLAVEGEARRILEAAKGGIFVPPEDPVAICDALVRLKMNPVGRQGMGEAGRRYVTNNFNRQASAARYLEVLERLVKVRKARG